MTHIMTLVTTYPTGAEDWLCPECGYRFVMRWQPFKRLCLVEGEQGEPHCGQRGGLVMGGVEVEQRQDLDMNVWGVIDEII
jgi:hypothetical protein